MKMKLFRGIVGFIVALSVANAYGTAKYEVPLAVKAPVIDGVEAMGEWDGALRIVGAGIPVDARHAEISLMWNSGHLYIKTKSESAPRNILSIQEETKTSIDCIRVVRFQGTNDRYILCSVNLLRVCKDANLHLSNNLRSPFLYGCKGVVLIVYAPSEMRMCDIYPAYKICEKNMEPYTVVGVLISKTKL